MIVINALVVGIAKIGLLIPILIKRELSANVEKNPSEVVLNYYVVQRWGGVHSDG